MKQLMTVFKKLTSDEKISSDDLRILSWVFLAISGGMSFFNYTHVWNVFGWDVWDTTVRFAPRLISTIIASAVLVPLYFRGILHWHKSPSCIVSFILILLVFASFVQLGMYEQRVW